MNFSSETSNEYAFKELSSLTGVKPYVLRFWESEFEEISPKLKEDGTKTYTQEDRDSVERIKDLLFGKKLSIQEAKGMLKSALEEKSIELAQNTVPSNTSLDSQTEKKESLSDSSVPSTPSRSAPSHSVTEERIFSYESSFELMRQSSSEKVQVKPGLNIDYSEKDMLSLLHAKKKLKVSLSKIEEIFTRYNW